MPNELTRREQEVLYGIAGDLTNQQIAASLGIGIGTVKAHVKRMFLKLNVNDRALVPLVALGKLEHAARLPRSRRA
ncbi:MAG: helix-turn-helix transcriptional regulator [Acidobacteria bacterium]|nr:helix-turn-helix transcriptional regulator [Acidobacteriota bacterium]